MNLLGVAAVLMLVALYVVAVVVAFSVCITAGRSDRKIAQLLARDLRDAVLWVSDGRPIGGNPEIRRSDDNDAEIAAACVIQDDALAANRRHS